MPPTSGAVPPGRREMQFPPKLVGKLLDDVARLQDQTNLDIFLTHQGSPVEHGATHAVGASDPLPLPLTIPLLVRAGITPEIGSGPSYMREDAQLAALTGAPTDLGEANAEGSGEALARALHVHKLLVRAAKAGVTTGTRKRLNFTDTATFQFTLADDAGNDEIDISGTVLLTGLTHNLLSATHPDTTPAAPVRGDLLVGIAGPSWSKLAIGATGRYLRAGATDPAWAQLDMGDAALGILALARGGSGSDLSGTGGAGFVIKQSGVGANFTSAALVDGDIPTTLSANARVTIRKNTGADVGTRRRLNLIEGSNVTLTVADDAGSEEVDITIASSGGGGGAPTNATYLVASLDATLTDERRLQGTANQVSLADGGAGGDMVLSTPQNIHTAATPQFQRMGLGVAADAAISLLLHNETNDNLPYELLALRRKRADATAPGAADFGADLAWRLEGFTNNSDVVAAKIRGAWDKPQTDDTTSRDSYLALYTMQGAFAGVLKERVRIDSEGNVMVAMQGALATNATDGFLHIPSSAGTPTGVPNLFTGMIPLEFDSSNGILYGYSGSAWKAIGPGTGGAGTDPPEGSYAPGSFTVATGKFRIMVDHLELTGTQEVALEGDSTLAIW